MLLTLSSPSDGPPGRQIDPLSRHVDKENHSQPLRPGRTTGNHESDSGAHTAAVDQLMRSVRPGLHIAGRAGELLQGSQTQSLSKAPSTSTGSLPTASISRSSTIKDSSPSFMNLIPTSSTPHATLDKGKGKAKEGVVIELDDDSSDHDSIKDDSDSSSRPVQTSRASNRARMNSAQGSSASRNIPSGNTQAKQAIFESTSRGQGTTIHQKPPSHSLNASPDSFSLEPQRKPKTLVSGMLSSRSSSTQRGKPKKPAVPDLHALPMNRVLTQDGTYYPGPAGLELVVCSDKESPYFAIQGECLTAKRGQPNKPNISDVVINPSHIQSITAPSDYGAALTFLRIDIDEEADLSDPASPRSPFCMSDDSFVFQSLK